MKLLLGPGRKDESQEISLKGRVLMIFKSLGVINFTGWGERGSGAESIASANEVTLANLSRVQLNGTALGEEGVDRTPPYKILGKRCAAPMMRTIVLIDPSVVRGLEYYTGPVYEVELLLETKDEKGRPVRFGSVGGGGRYDGLVSRFRGEPVPATGFSIGVSRLQAALTMIGKLESKPAPGPVLVTVFDRDRVADYQKMVAQLRNAGIRAELYLGNPKNNVGQQLKYADRRGSPCAVIQGGDEKAKGEVQIKDLIAGAGLTDIKDRDEYLKKQAEAQFAAPVDKLVDAVRQVLTRHGVIWS